MNIQRKNKLKVISLFSGCGGSSLGYKLAGLNVIACVEFDKNAVDCYKLNHPNTKIYHNDITKLDPQVLLNDLNLKKRELDILDGSPPCQGFSIAGKRKTLDNRNQLYKDYVRFLKAFAPKVFVMENVSGMIKGHMKLIFVEILKQLKSCGYKVKCQLLNAKHYNVPSSRERLIFIGVRNDINIEPSFPLGESQTISLQNALKGLDISNDTIRKLKTKGCLLYRNTKQGDSFQKACKKIYGKSSFFNSVRLSWGKPAPTIPKMVGTSIAQYCHPDEPRLMTISELKRIQTFPDEYKFIGKFEEQWARIGNSVPPNLMKAIALNIKNNILNYG